MLLISDCSMRPPRSVISRITCVLVSALVYLVASAAHAAENEIILRAERATLSQEEGTGLYEGNAELIQGQRSLNADRIEITLKDGKPSRVEATGTPVRLVDGVDLTAHAEKLVYDIEGGRILLFRKARITHQGRVFEGAELIYELQNRRISARGDEQEGDGRIRLVIPAEDGATTP
ncbi:lipopolysaccharide transport periplasmic protein LptA [Alcanivorax sp. 1008]|uniref:lipopolysaccharide transport periplasmic protein LptA n=1 Tax=Alcanivorax sp. 1008 TaxID=2816853 RepID=UPI001E309E2D|nr:lipopolysaccharide transport periplasmic protein LptA [Alcanivorax sp. 1008]